VAYDPVGSGSSLFGFGLSELGKLLKTLPSSHPDTKLFPLSLGDLVPSEKRARFLAAHQH